MGGNSSAGRAVKVALATAAVALVIPAASIAATIPVETFDDVSATECTLRDAITSANDDAAERACRAGSGSDRIVLDPSLEGEILLDTPLPVLESEISIQGTSPFLQSVSRNVLEDPGNFRLFQVSSEATVTLSGLTMSSGSIFTDAGPAARGGAIHSEGDLTVEDSVVNGNVEAVVSNPGSVASATAEGGAIYSGLDADLTVRDTVVKGGASASLSNPHDALAWGGGIMSRGSLTLVDSMVRHSGATASSSTTPDASGGGVYSLGPTVIRRSSIVENTTAGNATGGSITSFSNGAGLYHAAAPLTVDTSTIAGNAATGSGANQIQRGGGILVTNAPAEIRNSTIVGNSGNNIANLGAGSLGSIAVTSTIIGDSSGGGPDCSATGGIITSGGFNLSEGTSCPFNQSSDQSNVPDLGLLALANNGSPIGMRTMMPDPDGTSPAIDAGISGGAEVDTRGFDRIVDYTGVVNAANSDGTDVGAVEASPLVATLGPETDFGGVKPGNVSEAAVSVRNVTSGNITLSAPVLAGPDASFWSVGANDCAAPLAPNGVCQVSLTFSVPEGTPLGNRTAFLEFGNAQTDPMQFALRGEVLDGEAPRVTIKRIAVKAKKRSAKVIFSGSDNATGNLAYKCKVDSKPLRPCTSPWTVKRLKPGRHSVTVAGTDAAGNEGTKKKSFRVKKRR
jgi:hypothetical protein